IFFDEALRLDPGHAHARYNRGSAFLEMNDAQTALADCEAAITVARSGDDRLMMQLARSTIKIGLGRIGEGWDDYEARLAPLFAGATIFLVDLPAWTPETSIEGKTLLVMGEQGLGDEVLFANMLPDVIEALGPRGKLVLALEERLVGLFQRSFPTAEVVPHVTIASTAAITARRRRWAT
ncbi:MAG: flagellar protein FlbA, partial [Caulobacterales bacterium]